MCVERIFIEKSKPMHCILIYNIFFCVSVLNELAYPDGVVRPIEHGPVEVVTVVLIPSTQSIFEVAREFWQKNFK